jgi:hypothetical protein
MNMKKNILLVRLTLILVSMGFLSCSENIDNNLPDNKVYIVHGGEQGASTTLYETGVKDTLDLHLYRSGKYGTAATASVRVLSQSEVDEYNATYGTNYVAMPASVYSMLSTDVKYSDADEDVDRSVQIEFDPTAVRTITNANPETKYAVPVQIDGSNVDFNTPKNTAFVLPTVKDPLVYMGLTGFQSYTYKPTDNVQLIAVEFPINVDFKNYWDITCTIGSTQAALDEYNTAEGTFYSLLPAESYTLDNHVVIKKREKKTVAYLNVDGAKLSYGNYVLPVVLESASKFAVDATQDTYLIGVFIEAPILNKTDWTVTANSVAFNESIGSANALIDGNPSTYWHSRYGSKGEGVTNRLPYELVIDMKTNKSITQIDLQQRVESPFKDTKLFKVYISSDNSTWTLIGSYEAKQVEGMQPFGLLKSQGRYVKIVIETSYRVQNASLAEIDIHGE